MAQKIPMLALSPTMTDGTIAAWKFKEGQEVKKGSVLCEVETDKAVMDYEAPSSGVLLKIVVAEGGRAAVGDIIAVVGAAGEDPGPLTALAPSAVASAVSAPTASAVLPPSTAAPSAVSVPVGPAAPTAPAVSRAAPPGTADRAPALAPGLPRSSPLARVIARDAGLDLRSVAGTGPGGRVVKRDVEAALSGKAAFGAPDAHAGRAVASRAKEDRVEPLSRLRAVAARRLAASMQEAPHFFLRAAVEADRLLALRGALNAGRPEDGKLSLNAFFVKLAAVALERHPGINASWNGDSLIYRGSVDVALAVALPEGLVAPVVRDCASKGVEAIDRELRALISKARSSSLRVEDYEGAGFTISNLGAWGVEEFTAIVNPPGSAILALGAVAREPVARTGPSGAEEIVVRSMLRATLSCDHRVIDGAAGAAFLRDLKELVEEPGRALL